MKSTFLLLLLSSLSIIVSAQKQTPLLLISEKQCSVSIDGAVKGTVKNGAPLTIKVALGEHYLEAKAGTEVFTQVINCTDEKQKVITIKFGTKTPVKDPSKEPAPATAVETELINKTLKLRGMFGNADEQRWTFSFDKSDKIKFHFTLNETKGTNTISVYSYDDKKEVYKEGKVTELTDSFTIPRKAVYVIEVSTNYISGRNSTIVLSRTGNPKFNLIPVSKSDTSFTSLNDIKQIITATNTAVPLNLPEGTTAWVYWIGIGDEPLVKYEAFKEYVLDDKSGNEGNPIWLYGTKAITRLPVYNSLKRMDYQFADYSNKNLFLANNSYKYYSIKTVSGITADYGMVTEKTSDINLLVKTTAEHINQPLHIKLGAFVIKTTMVVAE